MNTNLEILKRYFREATIEMIKADWEAASKISYEGPTVNDMEEYFKSIAKKTNRYQEGEVKGNQSCALCKRKRLSFPDTCNDGWPMGEKTWKDRGGNCINFLPFKSIK